MKNILHILFFYILCSVTQLNAEEIPYLLTASAKGDIETVKAIIQSGGDPNTEDKDKIRDNIRKNILKLKSNNSKIIGYASPAKATTALNFFGISNEIECIVEDNKLKHGKFLPGMNIPITSKTKIKKKPDYALVLAWNFFDEIKKNNSDLAHKFINIKDLEN